MRRPASLDDTIVAIATPPGEGGIGVVRISGPDALAVAEKIFAARSGRVEDQKNFTARYGRIVERTADGSTQAVDEALLLVMRAPKSYTAEDTVEISAHGGHAILQATVRLALAAGARGAEPGEFTKRAFLNGRIDLLQAEAVLDLIQARTERSRDWALSQLEGALSKKMGEWKDELIDLMSHLEASMDFPDDFPETDPLERIRERLEAVSSDLDAKLKDSDLAFTAKRGFRVALWGRPNVGKSSLMNRLTRTERVIVTPYPGTTRDVVEEQSSLGGFPVRFQDTAGIRETSHPIEKEGVERSRQAASGADLVLCLLDSSESFTPEDEALLKSLPNKNSILVLNKCDLPQKLRESDWRAHVPASWPVVPCSCVQEQGTRTLEKCIVSRIAGGRVDIPEEVLIGTARQKALLEQFSKDLQAAREACSNGAPAEIIACEVRAGLDHLAELVGEVFTDDILERLFGQFCIGK